MNRLTVALLLSLAANAALGVWAWSRARTAASAPPATPLAATTTAPEPAIAPAATATTVAPEAQHTALRERLRALGFSDDEVRRAVRAEIEAPRQARTRELRRATQNDPSFWTRTWGYAAGFATKDREELDGMRRAERAEMLRLFGPGAQVESGALATLGFLPPDKALRVATINQDYADLRREVTENKTGDVAATRERERLLAAEQERDLAAVLTPDERLALTIRDSDTASRLKRQMGGFDASDEEYRAIFALQKAYDDKHPGEPTYFGGVGPRTPDRDQLIAAIGAALGPERLVTWNRAQLPESQILLEVKQRFNLAPATHDAIARLPAETSLAAIAVANDAKLDPAQKAAALRDLAGRAREKIRSLLGPDLGDAYNTASTSAWLGYLDRANVYTYQPDGTVSLSSVGRSPLPSAPPPPR